MHDLRLLSEEEKEEARGGGGGYNNFQNINSWFVCVAKCMHSSIKCSSEGVNIKCLIRLSTVNTLVVNNFIFIFPYTDSFDTPIFVCI